MTVAGPWKCHSSKLSILAESALIADTSQRFVLPETCCGRARLLDLYLHVVLRLFQNYKRYNSTELYVTYFTYFIHMQDMYSCRAPVTPPSIIRTSG